MIANRSSAAHGVVGYIRVSNSEQAESGLGLAAQRAAIEAECARRGLQLLEVFEDIGPSAKRLDRAALKRAFAELGGQRASILMVSRLDRVSRSVRDASEILDRSRFEGWALVALDLNIDFTTPSGHALGDVVSVFSQLERRMTGQRTRELAEAKARGVTLGRPESLAQEVRSRIVQSASDGLGWSAIARQLNDECVPTAQGGAKWWPTTVRAIALASGVDRDRR